jgi:hypothetical protein
MPPDLAAELADERLFCPRCEKPMRVERPSRGFAIAYRVWIGVMGLCVFCTPIFIADMVTMLPLMCAAALGGGTLSRLAKAPSRCRWCSLALESPPRGFRARRVLLDPSDYLRERETSAPAPPE